MSNRLIFISYSHKDKNWKDRLVTQLGVLEQQGTLEVWTDDDIGAGEDWYQKIENALESASVAILLVSASSLSSTFILRKEVVRLLQLRDEAGLRIFPIIATDCLWEKHKWLAKMQVRPRDRRPLQEKSAARKNTELTNIAAEIAKIIEAASDLAPTSPEGIAERQDRAQKPIQSTMADEEESRLREKLRQTKEKAAALERKLLDMGSKDTTKGTPDTGPTSEYQEGRPAPDVSPKSTEG
jgi:MTH538 TIR-like domain (DUF1863).